jgi:membrane protease YdiL (CAAX protease family)
MTRAADFEGATMPANRSATLWGLAIALLAGPALTLGYRLITGENHSNLQVVGRELGIFLLVGLLLWIVRRREMLPLSSVGLHADRLGRSLLRGLVLTVVTLGVTVGLYLLLQQFGIRLGEGGGDRFHPALWVVVLIMLRAGIAEEIFYRGYAIERLASLTGSKWLGALVPLIVFAAAHYRQGAGGIIAAFVLGGIFTAFYVRFRDLLTNITAHFLGDFVLNVVLPLLGAG